MLKYIDADDYVEIKKTDVPDNFDELVIKASAYINKNTFYRIDSTNVPDEVKYCTIEIVNVLNDEDTQLNGVSNVKSENVDGWSRSYSTTQELHNEYEYKKRELLTLYLSNVIGTDGNPLLYRGVIY